MYLPHTKLYIILQYVYIYIHISYSMIPPCLLLKLRSSGLPCGDRGSQDGFSAPRKDIKSPERETSRHILGVLGARPTGSSNSNSAIVFSNFLILHAPKKYGIYCFVVLGGITKVLTSSWSLVYLARESEANMVQFLKMVVYINMFPATPWFAHTQTTHPNNMIYLSPEDQWKHWLYAVILTFSFHDLGFYFRV